MTHPVLPKLKMGHTVTIFTKAGTWDVRQQDSLEHLSKGLKVDKIETDLSSIPDMWARPILFEMALLNPEHVLHARILGEWRGLLAMLALKKVLGLDALAAAAVALPSVEKSQGESAEPPAQNVRRDFLQTLAKLLPTATLAADTSWQYLYAFLFNGKPVGMTSPTTLVATAADYLDRINSQEVRWYDGIRLLDPVTVLASRQKETLAGWLDRLIAQMSAHRGLDTNRWNLLVGLLRAFSKELGPGSANVGLTSLGIRGQEAGFFKYLDKPADAATDGKEAKDASHVSLIPSKGRLPQKPLFVVDRSIADQWNMALQDVTVYAAQTLDTGKIRIEHADVWSGTDFFTKELFVIFQESAFPGAAGAGHQLLKLPGGTTGITPLLPIEAALLEHLTAEDLARRVRWEQVQDGLKLHLSLQLTGTDFTAPGRSIELSKLYKREDIRTLDNVPILEIWPNFIAPGWQAYYTCYSTDDATTTFEAVPWGAHQVEQSEVSLGGQRRRRYWLGNSYPEAMVCRATLANERTGQMDVRAAGLLLLSLPHAIPPQGNTCKVGVDFGASSTTICAATGRASSPVRFNNRNVSVTASGDKAQAQLFDFFLPRQPIDMPVLSFFHDFANNLDGQALRPLLDGHAYLLETPELFSPETRGLTFDLKWSREGADRRRIRAFLKQLCLQTAAELVAQGAVAAQWAFSFPTAFTDEQKQGFPAIWQQVIEHCAAQSGLKQVQPLVQLTESEAAALYFVNHRNAATAVGTIFIDIGGSTSDVSVWQGNRQVWQTSVLLAGRSIFSNYLWHNPGFLDLLGLDAAKRLPVLKEANQNDRRSYHAFTDTILRYMTPRIFQALPLHAGDAQVKALRQHLALGVCGLFFYVGSLLRHLTETGCYRQAVPNVYVGGNGSRILRWLDIDGDGRINAMYKALFSRGAGWSDEKPFSVILSPEPKSEAAYGLISDRGVQTDRTTYPVLAGEVFSVEESIDELPATHRLQEGETRELPWNVMLTPAVFTGKLAPPQKMARLAEFIDAFNQFAKDNGIVAAVDTDHAQLEEVRRRLGQSLSRYRGKDSVNVVVEPVFIMALRHWLEIKLDG